MNELDQADTDDHVERSKSSAEQDGWLRWGDLEYAYPALFKVCDGIAEAVYDVAQVVDEAIPWAQNSVEWARADTGMNNFDGRHAGMKAQRKMDVLKRIIHKLPKLIAQGTYKGDGGFWLTDRKAEMMEA